MLKSVKNKICNVSRIDAFRPSSLYTLAVNYVIYLRVIIARTCIVRSICALRRESGTVNGVDGR